MEFGTWSFTITCLPDTSILNMHCMFASFKGVHDKFPKLEFPKKMPLPNTLILLSFIFQKNQVFNKNGNLLCTHSKLLSLLNIKYNYLCSPIEVV